MRCWDLSGREERREQARPLLLVNLLLLLLPPSSAAVKRDDVVVVVVVVVVIIRELTLPKDVTLDLKDLRFRCAVVAIVTHASLSLSLSLSFFSTFSLFLLEKRPSLLLPI